MQKWSNLTFTVSSLNEHLNLTRVLVTDKARCNENVEETKERRTVSVEFDPDPVALVPVERPLVAHLALAHLPVPLHLHLLVHVNVLK